MVWVDMGYVGVSWVKCVVLSKVGQRFVVLSKDGLAWTWVEWNGLGWFGMGVLEWIGMR